MKTAFVFFAFMTAYAAGGLISSAAHGVGNVAGKVIGNFLPEGGLLNNILTVSLNKAVKENYVTQEIATRVLVTFGKKMLIFRLCHELKFFIFRFRKEGWRQTIIIGRNRCVAYERTRRCRNTIPRNVATSAQDATGCAKYLGCRAYYFTVDIRNGSNVSDCRKFLCGTRSHDGSRLGGMKD